MSVDRTRDQDAQAILTVHFSRAQDEPSSMRRTSNATPAASEPSRTIDMKHKSAADIWSELREVTSAVEIAATAEEDQQLRDLAEPRVRSERDREQLREVVAARRREEQFLEQARSAVA